MILFLDRPSHVDVDVSGSSFREERREGRKRGDVYFHSFAYLVAAFALTSLIYFARIVGFPECEHFAPHGISPIITRSCSEGF